MPARRLRLFRAGGPAAQPGARAQSAHPPDTPVWSTRPDGRSSLADLRGKVVVLAPFLSLCQDECPLVTGAFIALQRDLRAAGMAGRVVFVEATVDPGRDTVARLAAYRTEFGADWELWTGSPAQVAAFWHPFGVQYETVAEGQPPKTDWWTGTPLTYDVEHTDGYILVDAPATSASSTPTPPTCAAGSTPS